MRKGSRAIEVAMILPGKKYEQGDEHECAENQGNELPDSHPLAQSAITNRLEVAIVAKRAQSAVVPFFTCHFRGGFIWTAVVDTGVKACAVQALFTRAVGSNSNRPMPYRSIVANTANTTLHANCRTEEH
jgi:hypothetical protein